MIIIIIYRHSSKLLARYLLGVPVLVLAPILPVGTKLHPRGVR